MPRVGFSRRQFLYLLTAASVMAGSGFAIFNLWLLGRQSVRLTFSSHRVTGGSMAPTLWGEHYEATCPSCNIQFKIDASSTSSLAQDNSSQVQCWHCGEDFDRPTGPTLAGDNVDAEPIDELPTLNRDQLVVIRLNEGLHLKRILGVPGDTISLADNAISPLQLSINGEWCTSNEVTIPVDRDTLRTTSRWSSWQRVNTTWRCTATPSPSPSLVYTHHNVHDFDKVTVVMDDCPANALIARPLYPVSRLLLRFQLTCSSPIKLLTTFGDSDYAAGAHDVVLRGANTEIKIQVISSSKESDVCLSDIQLDRFVDYRLRRTDDQSLYPVKLSDNEYFVVGDNVPISIDSRNFGPIRRNQIVAWVRN